MGYFKNQLVDIGCIVFSRMEYLSSMTMATEEKRGFYLVPDVNTLRTIHRCIRPLVNLKQLLRSAFEYPRYLRDWVRYSALPGSEILHLKDAYPCLEDRTSTTPFDSHYFYQGVWAFDRIRQTQPLEHVDVGSSIVYIGYLTTITKVIFIDIRPLEAKLPNLENRSGTVLSLPFADGSVKSLSSMHVIEHIGLGRYGDPLDTLGTQKAVKEFLRVLAPGGNLFVSVPVGKPRVCFNSHRVFDPMQVVDFFSPLRLLEFAVVDDDARFFCNVTPSAYSASKYACGMYWFQRG